MSEVISILAIAAVIFGLGVLAGLCWSLVIIDRREPPPNPYDEFKAPDYPPPWMSGGQQVGKRQDPRTDLETLPASADSWRSAGPHCPTCDLGRHNRVAVAHCPDPFHREVVAS